MYVAISTAFPVESCRPFLKVPQTFALKFSFAFCFSSSLFLTNFIQKFGFFSCSAENERFHLEEKVHRQHTSFPMHLNRRKTKPETSERQSEDGVRVWQEETATDEKSKISPQSPEIPSSNGSRVDFFVVIGLAGKFGNNGASFNHVLFLHRLFLFSSTATTSSINNSSFEKVSID